MINLTPLVRPALLRRLHPTGGCEAVQRRVLERLITAGTPTDFGRTHGLDPRMSYEHYAGAVQPAAYPDFRPFVERMVAGEPDVLWPGVCRRFAQSSGTSDGKSKYIPVTDASLRYNHYAGATDVVARYLALYPDSRIFAGKAMILGGSFANEIADLPPGVKVGDLSASLIDNINPLANMVRIPDKATALMADWHEKLPRLARAALKADVTNISGVPSWFLTVLREIISLAGAETIHDVWPNLEVFFHGGISFAPYQSQYEAITDPSRMRYFETYNASEGFFAVQGTRDRADGMDLLLHRGIFYEFIPVGSPGATPLPAWEVEKGKVYSLLITAPNGLWRYAPGDTVRIESTKPLRISIAGRTHSYINTFGEELMVDNADRALTAACHATGASVANYTAAPVFTTERSHGRHQWLIEWHKAPADIEAFADILDRELQAVNSDYQAKREGSIFLDRLSITTASTGLFDRWLGSNGKLGGQRKVPRLCNSRTVIDSMLKLNNYNH